MNIIYIKIAIDVIITAVLSLILLPLFIIIWLLIKISSPGSVIFRQQRTGKDGKSFIFYKFRTMRTDVDPFGSSPKSGEDPRLTKIGKFLREYSLDELPQILDVLRGDMSIIEPRQLYMKQMVEWNEDMCWFCYT